MKYSRTAKAFAFAATSLLAASATLLTTPSQATPPKAHSHATCADAQAWFEKTYGEKAGFAEMQVKTTTGGTCTVSFGTYNEGTPSLSSSPPAVDYATCASAQASLTKFFAASGETGGSFEMTANTKDGQKCVLKYGK